MPGSGQRGLIDDDCLNINEEEKVQVIIYSHFSPLQGKWRILEKSYYLYNVCLI